jgi:hypothetical protein
MDRNTDKERPGNRLVCIRSTSRRSPVISNSPGHARVTLVSRRDEGVEMAARSWLAGAVVGLAVGVVGLVATSAEKPPTGSGALAGTTRPSADKPAVPSVVVATHQTFSDAVLQKVTDDPTSRDRALSTVTRMIATLRAGTDVRLIGNDDGLSVPRKLDELRTLRRQLDHQPAAAARPTATPSR